MIKPMNLAQRIQTILVDDSLDDDSSDTSKSEAVEALLKDYGWDPVQDYLLHVLADDSQADQWRAAAEVFWGAGLDRMPVPVNRWIALLYHRFDPDGSDEDNLVWSITCRLKGVSYLSDYRPLDDPGVKEELRALRNP